MDLVMPGIGGLEAVRRIAALHAGTKVLVLSGYLQEDRLLDVLAAGAKGFVAGEPAEPHARDPTVGTQRSLPRSERGQAGWSKHEQQPRAKGKVP